jgi:hypothetical protein
MMQIEVTDKLEYVETAEVECASAVADIVACLRNIVKFFHTRNSCDCLEKIYQEELRTSSNIEHKWQEPFNFTTFV